MPMLLLLFAVIIDGGRMMWSYQTAVAGVRDATRYLARVAPVDICTTGGSVAGYTATLTGIVQNSIYGNQLFPNGIAVNSVMPSILPVSRRQRLRPPSPIKAGYMAYEPPPRDIPPDAKAGARRKRRNAG